ncbi:MAG: hypothetical protein HYS13_02385 [Planctomycetia bacterium]|nr:hypothetical protein [Planctomycetia bacterium]
MNRRLLLSVLCAMLALPAALAHGDTSTTTSVNGRAVTLRDTLENGLRASLPAEKKFIGRVVVLVDRGKLKEDLVKAIFERARQRDFRHPFPYFKVMMTTVANKEGVPLR